MCVQVAACSSWPSNPRVCGEINLAFPCLTVFMPCTTALQFFFCLLLVVIQEHLSEGYILPWKCTNFDKSHFGTSEFFSGEGVSTYDHSCQCRWSTHAYAEKIKNWRAVPMANMPARFVVLLSVFLMYGCSALSAWFSFWQVSFN